MRVALCAATVVALGISAAAFAQPGSSQDDQILKQGTSSGGTEAAPPAVDDEELSTTYSSIGLQKVSADFDNVKDAINLDFTMIGFRVPTVNWFAVELNLGFTMAPGQITQTSSTGATTCPITDPFCTPGGGSSATSQSDFTTTTIGAFGVLRSPGTVFGMAKYGYRYMNTSLDQLQNDRSGTAYGFGVGYRWNKKGSYVELGYTKIAEKISGIGFAISYSYDRR